MCLGACSTPAGMRLFGYKHKKDLRPPAINLKEEVPFSRGLIKHVYFRSPCTSSLARCLGTLGQTMHCSLSFIPSRYQERMSEQTHSNRKKVGNLTLNPIDNFLSHFLINSSRFLLTEPISLNGFAYPEVTQIICRVPLLELCVVLSIFCYATCVGFVRLCFFLLKKVIFVCR